MAAIERFDKWIATKELDKYKYNLQRVYEGAKMLDYDKDYVDSCVQELRRWLIKNAGNPRTNKKHWGHFILRNLIPRNYGNQGRLLPSNFD